MTFANHQLRLSTLFHITTAVACSTGLILAIGIDGIMFLLVLAALPLLVALLAVSYVRAMSWLFDVFIGPFMFR